MNQIKIQQYGWLRDLPDQRDYKLTPVSVLEQWWFNFTQWFSNLFKKPSPVSATVDLRAMCPPVYDQGQLGSCVSNAVAGMHEFMQKKEGAANPFIPSRLFVYYNSRVLEGTVSYDAGSYVRDAMKVINQEGACKESTWPYVTKQFAVKPPDAAYLEALNHQSLQYLRVSQNLTDLKKCLADGYPFVFGFTVYESFESATVAKTGVVPMPKLTEKVLGGHAVMAVGYDATRKAFLVRNSWGPNWGMQGYFWMPFEYLTNAALSSDFWTLRKVEV